jgi:hypothetical protein
MLTVVETLLFQKQWPRYSTEFDAKAKTDNITGAKLKEIRHALEN